MTPWLLTIVPLIIGLTGWVVRALVLDRIKLLEERVKAIDTISTLVEKVKTIEEANIRQGERLGKLEQAAAVDHAIREFSGRIKP